MINAFDFVLEDFGIADYRAEKWGFIHALLKLGSELDPVYDGPPGAGCYSHVLAFFESRLGQSHFVTQLFANEFNSRMQR